MTIPKHILVFAVLMDISLTLGLCIFFIPELSVLRNHVGDIAAAAFVFSLLALLITKTSYIAAITLGFAISLELLQAIDLFEKQTRVSQFFLGHTFDVIDIIVYCLAVLILSLLHLRLRSATAT